MTDPFGFGPPRCPVCNTEHAACGVVPKPRYVLDVPTKQARRPAMPADKFVFEVPIRNGTTTMKLTEAEAREQYGDAAKKVGPAKSAAVQPVLRPPHATNASDVTERPELPESEAEPAEHLVTSKKAPPPANKARHAADKQA